MSVHKGSKEWACTACPQVYDTEEKDPNPPPPPEEGQEEQTEPPPPIVVQVPELAVLKHRIDQINESTGVMPVVGVSFFLLLDAPFASTACVSSECLLYPLSLHVC